MNMNSRFLFYKEIEGRSQYVHTGRRMSKLPGGKAQFEIVPKNNTNFCGKTTSQLNTLHMVQTKVAI
jgi:hypothetical protein